MRLGTRQRRCLRWLADIEVWDPSGRPGTVASLRSTCQVMASLARHGLAEPVDHGVMIGSVFVWGYRITDEGRRVAGQL